MQIQFPTMFKSEKTSSLEESGDNTPTLIVVGAVENILSEFADVKNHNSSGLTSKVCPRSNHVSLQICYAAV